MQRGLLHSSKATNLCVVFHSNAGATIVMMLPKWSATNAKDKSTQRSQPCYDHIEDILAMVLNCIFVTVPAWVSGPSLTRIFKLQRSAESPVQQGLFQIAQCVEFALVDGFEALGFFV